MEINTALLIAKGINFALFVLFYSVRVFGGKNADIQKKKNQQTKVPSGQYEAVGIHPVRIVLGRLVKKKKGSLEFLIKPDII